MNAALIISVVSIALSIIAIILALSVQTNANNNAETLDGMDSTDFQKRISGSCVAGTSIRQINTDGTVDCENDM
jgi:hypothetical protein